MKIFQLIDSRSFGGIETHILNLSLYLKNKGIDNTVVFVSNYKSNELRDLLITNNIKFSEPTNLFKFMNVNKKSLWHSHGYKANILNKFNFYVPRNKKICSYHSGEKFKNALFVYEIIDKKTTFLSNKNIAISEKIKNQLFNHKIEIVYNFIFKESISEPINKLKNISFVGRLSTEKNVGDFIKIANSNDSEFLFNIFGNGNEFYKINENDNVVFKGYTIKQDDIWDNTDTLLITSLYEGLPYTLIEGMCAGKIIISTKVGEIPNIINHGVNGFLVDDVNDFNVILNDLKMNKYDLNEISKESMKTFSKLFGKKAGRHFLDIYEMILKK